MTTDDRALTEAQPTIDGTSGDGRLATGSLGTGHIVFMVLAAVAPAGFTVSLLPLAIGLGVGVGTPGMLLLVAIALLIFSVGYTRMAPYIRNAGAMFAYIVHGLGRPIGLAAAYVALLAYLSIGCATAGAAGFFGAMMLANFLGIHVSWWVVSLLCVAIAFVLGYRKITLAAGVLGVALIAEAVAVVVLDLGILIHHGFSSFGLDSFNPHYVVLSGVVGVGIVYGVAGFQGFEGTAIYAEEARDPHVTVRRATYLSVVLAAAFYVLTAWALVAGGGGTGAPGAALADPGNYAFTLATDNVGAAWSDVLQLLVFTSSLAGVLAFHNAASRYMFALGRDEFLPRRLSAVHAKHESPHVAGVAAFVIMGLVIAGFAIAGLDPLTNLASSTTGVGAIGVVALLALTSLAVLVFFWRRGQRGWANTVAPAIGILLLGSATVLALVNYDAITGSRSTLINSLPVLHLVVIIVAVGVAVHAKKHRPAAYQSMGRTQID